MIKRTKMSKLYLTWCFLYICIFKMLEATPKWSEQEESNEYWNAIGRETLQDILQRRFQNKPAKNVILFLGDGMNLATMTAGRILKGQSEGQSGEETITMLDKFKSVGLSKVYSIDKQTPDSASTATAILSGVKTKFGTLGLNGKVVHSNCRSQQGNEVESILETSAKEGKSTGVITTTQVQHASPAATYAHSARRGWLSDGDIPLIDRRLGCKDIALQLFEKRNDLNVVLGGGRRYMRPRGTFDEEEPTLNGRRKDGRDLINEWINTMPPNESRYVWNKSQFDSVDPANTTYLLGLFEPTIMKYEHLRSLRPDEEPSLSEMTGKAIQVLQKNEKGYFLFVEGGKIDHAHHATRAQIALNEFLAFEKAVETAVNMTSMEDTLIIVTADHGHGFSLGGDAERGNPIFGFASSNESPSEAQDGKRYTAVSYANGAGHQGANNQRIRVNLTEGELDDLSYRFQTAVPLSGETHSAEDVIIMARGPMSHLFSGTFQQSYISHAMKYASCIGSNKELCEEHTDTNENEITNPITTTLSPNVSVQNCTKTNEKKELLNRSIDEVSRLFIEVDGKIKDLVNKIQLIKSLKM